MPLHIKLFDACDCDRNRRRRVPGGVAGDSPARGEARIDANAAKAPQGGPPLDI
jgi:hypothetical protein